MYAAPRIEVAEAAKVIEKTQRDLNIALMNELAITFDRLDIDTHEVLEAAGTNRPRASPRARVLGPRKFTADRLLRDPISKPFKGTTPALAAVLL